MHMKRYNGTRRLGVESLELRMMLTGEGVELPVASMVPSMATELIPTGDGQISRAVALDLNGDDQLDYAAALSGQTRRLVFLIADNGGYSPLNMPAVTDNYFEDMDFGDINGDELPDVVCGGREGRPYLYQSGFFARQRMAGNAAARTSADPCQIAERCGFER